MKGERRGDGEHSVRAGMPRLASESKEGDSSSLFPRMHACIHVHVTNTIACKTIVCNTTDKAVLSKKFAFMERKGYVDELCIPELRNMVGGLHSTVGGLC